MIAKNKKIINSKFFYLPQTPDTRIISALLILMLFVFITIVSFRISTLWDPNFKTAIQGFDDSYYYFWVRSFIIDGDLDFRNDLEITPTMQDHLKVNARTTPPTKTGLMPNIYIIGWAISAAPWFVLGHFLAYLLNLVGYGIPYDGYAAPYQIMVILGQILYAITSLWLAYRMISHFFSTSAAAIAVCTIWLASSLMFYQTKQVAESHNFVFFTITLCYWSSFQLLNAPSRLKYWLLIALSGSLSIITRSQSVVYLIFPLITVLRIVIDNPKLWTKLLLAVITGIMVLIPQFLAWKVVYGHYIIYTHKGMGFNWLSPKIGEVLFSPHNGWLYTHPLLLFSILFFTVWVMTHKQWITACWMFSLILTIYINAAWYQVFFGYSFGHRGFETSTLFAMFGLAWWITYIRQKSAYLKATLFVIVFLIGWNLNLAYLHMQWRDTLGSPIEYPFPYQKVLSVSFNYWKQFLF